MRSVFLMGVALLFSSTARAVVVDRIAVAVGNRVITTSDIDLRIRLTAFQNDETPAFTIASRRQAVERLIDQRLVEHEMDLGHYPRLPRERGRELLAEYAKSNYASDGQAMSRALDRYDLTDADLEGDLLRQADLLTFLNLRFRPGVQVTEEDIRNYFNSDALPRVAAQRQQTLEEMRARIEQQLTDAAADKQLDAWLLDQRKRTKIDYVDKDFASSEIQDKKK